MYYQGYFFTDTWQATNKLTVTAGLRWEIPGVYTERSTASELQPDGRESGAEGRAG